MGTRSPHRQVSEADLCATGEMTQHSLSLCIGEEPSQVLWSHDLGWEEDQVHRHRVENDRNLLGCRILESAGELKHGRAANTAGGMNWCG